MSAKNPIKKGGDIMNKELKITESVSIYGRKIITVNEPSKELMAQVLKRLIDKRLYEVAKEKANSTKTNDAGQNK